MINRNGGNVSLRPHHALTVVVTAVVAMVVAYVAFGFVIGVLAFLVKTAFVIAVVVGAVYFVLRWANRSGR